ncbi:MAG: glutathione S-transferase family protein [Rhizobiales bacterium]|nr:glutathione S-transferase family protein [Hyphomicrobiales bacterium]
MMKLYARAGAGSAAIEALLAEAGVPFEMVEVKKPAPESFLKINPLGQVPALQLEDGAIMTESAAMMIYLADLYGFAPKPESPRRPRFLKWLLFMATALYMSDLRMYYPERYSTDVSHAPGIKTKAIADMDREFEILSNGLGEEPFFLGEDFSAADIYAPMLVSWAADVPAVFAKHPNLKTHYDRVAARPRIAEVWKRNGMP